MLIYQEKRCMGTAVLFLIDARACGGGPYSACIKCSISNILWLRYSAANIFKLLRRRRWSRWARASADTTVILQLPHSLRLAIYSCLTRKAVEHQQLSAI